jgi:hypothetical protein
MAAEYAIGLRNPLREARLGGAVLVRLVRLASGSGPSRLAGPYRGQPSERAFQPLKQDLQHWRPSPPLLQFHHNQVLLEQAFWPLPVVQDKLEFFSGLALDPLHPRIGVFMCSMESRAVLLEGLLQHWVHARAPDRHGQAPHGH